MLSIWGATGGAKPTLSLQFAGATSLDSRITFSRGTQAMMYGSSGLLQYAPNNLLTYSQDFTNAAWTTPAGSIGPIGVNSTIAPDGTFTASTVSATSANTIFWQTYLPSAAGISYTGSIWIKRKTGSGNIQVTSYDSSTFANVDLSGGGWVRATQTNTSTIGTKAVGIRIVTSGDEVYIWGAQLAQGSIAQTYNATTSAAYYGPRFDYDPFGYAQQNLLTYSQQFDNAAWSATAGSINANTTTAPDGTVTADKFVADSATSQHYFATSSTYNSVLPDNSIFTLSIYAKAAEKSSVAFSLRLKNSTFAQAEFNLSTQALTSSANLISSSITSVGNGWYRCSITANCSSGAGAMYPGFSDTFSPYTGNGVDGLYLWGAQLNTGTSALPYAATTSAPYTLCTPKGLLIEEARTNVSLYAQDFTQATWAKSGTAATASAATGPDGTTSAGAITCTAVNASHYVNQTMTITTGAYTCSFYAKYVSNRWLVCRMADGVSGYFASFDIQNGVVGAVSGATSTITSVGNGWYRCTLTATSAGTTGGFIIGLNNADSASLVTWTAAGTETVYVYGAQLEAGSFATSYIPTVASTVTRSADSLSTTALSTWFNASAGTFIVQADVPTVGASSAALVALSAGATYGAGNGFLVRVSGTAIQVGGNASAVASGGTIAVNTAFKGAGAYQGTTEAACLNGGAVNSLSTNDFTGSGTTTFLIGAITTGGTQQFSGHIQNICYYSTRLPNSTLQALTA